MGENGLQVLSARVQALVDKCRSLLAENSGLKAEVEEARARLDVLEQELAALRAEKEEVRGKVGALIELIDMAGIAPGGGGGKSEEMPLLISGPVREEG